ncbi:MAG: FAD-dependent oxidoreductase [Candidatus Melainabacteria bacterium]|nr:FAD-dependent oxidoreductase [Candidatus Melainabacteria bacterium]
MVQKYDIAIIGGGIIGASIAACLAINGKNLKIAVIDSKDLGMSASQAAAGLLTPFQPRELENKILKDFSFSSFEYFQTFYKIIKDDMPNIDLGFKQSGSFYVVFSNLEFGDIESKLKKVKDITKTIFLNKQELIKQEPLISRDAIGAYYNPFESYLNNQKFLKAINSFCKRRRVDFLNNFVEDIDFSESRVNFITLSNKDIISADSYVICNGAWANKFLKKIFNIDKINENIIKAIKGEILQIETNQKLPFEKIIFSEKGYMLPRPATNKFEKDTILIGSTSDEVNLEKDCHIFKNTPLGINSLTSLFKNMFPSCKDYFITNMWAGLRPKTIDELPILGSCFNLKNLYLSLGHYRHGILMGPYCGKILSDLILSNNSECNIEAFKIDRLYNNCLV